MKKIIVFLIFNSVILPQTIILNEIMSSNFDIIKDDDGDYSDWIEIFNQTDTVINLTGFSLSDDNSNKTKWIFPNVNINSNEYLLIFASGKNKYSSELHTNFKLDKDGEELFLCDNFGFTIDNYNIPKLEDNISIGRNNQDFSGWLFFNNPTPGFTNSSQGFNSTTTSPKFIKAAGFYTNSIEVEIIKPNDSTKIFYTLNGSEPNEFSTEYVNPIYLDSSKVIRAKCFSKNNLPSETITSTYFINENSTLPVISLSSNPDNFWNDEYGIYIKGNNGAIGDCGDTANYNQDWERPANIEFFENNTKLAFNIGVGVKIHGGCTRRLPQKSLSIIARSSYGSKHIPYPVFPNLPYNVYSSILLRNSGNDNVSSFFRDALIQVLIEKVDIEAQAYRPASVFLNGKYFGLFNIREIENVDYLIQHRNLSNKSIDLLYHENSIKEGSNLEYVNLIEFVKNNNLENENNYNYVASKIDINNYIKYMLTQMYIVNRDWFPGNTKFWRSQTDSSKWRWIVYDTDYSFGLFDMETISMNMINFVRDPNKYPSVLINGLLQNEKFKNNFINTYADLLNSIFRSEYVINKIDSIKKLIQNEIPKEIERWQNIDSYDSWLANIEELKFFANNRQQYMTQNFIEEFNLEKLTEINLSKNDRNGGTIKINSVNITSDSWSGKYFNNIPVQLSAVPKFGYTFNGWSGDTTSSEMNITYIFKESNNVIANFQPIISSSVVINEINFNSNNNYDSDDWIEIYNNSDNLINISNWMLKDDNDLHKFIIPKNTYLNSNSYIVLCNDTTKFSNIFNSVHNKIGNIGFGFSSNGELIRLFDNFGNLIDFVEYDDKIPWPLEPNGNGPTLELINPNLENNLGFSWSHSINIGTPGNQNSLFKNDYLIISEDSLVSDANKNELSMYIESSSNWNLQNISSWIAVNPNSGIGNQNITLEVSQNNDSLTRKSEILFSNNKLSQKIKIIQNGLNVYTVDVLVDSLNSGSIGGIGRYKENSIVSLVAIPNSGWKFLNWEESDSAVSFDSVYTFVITKDKFLKVNFIRIPTDIEKENVLNNFELFQNYPNPFNATTTIRYSIPEVETYALANGFSSVQIKIYDIIGRVVAILVNQKKTPGNYEVIFDANNLSSGIYYYQIKTGNFTKVMKMVLLK